MDLSRRRLLQAGLAGATWAGASGLPGLDAISGAADAMAATPAKCLVMVYLQGGNDGLGVVNPGSAATTDYNAYVAARPVLHRGQGATPSGGRTGSQDIPGTSGQLAWSNAVLSSAAGGDNGSSTFGFDTLFGDGLGGAGSELAILPSTDYSPSNLSHFDSSDYWFAGALSGMTTGWLGRWIDNNGSSSNPLQAVSIDTSLSKAIRSARNPVCAINASSAGKTTDLGFSMNPSGGYAEPSGHPSPTNINAQMTAFSQVAAGNPLLTRDRATFGQAVSVAGSGTAINGLAADSAGYPANSQLARKLKLAARILSANVGTRIITVHWGGFDTHGSQLSGQDPQLSELSIALGAFKADLKARGVEQSVATMVFSEFGRRVVENGSAGTDHGAGGFMMLSGSGVKGGLAADWPGVSSLDNNGNLKATADFRAAYQSILSDWLSGDLTGVLPGGPFPFTGHGGRTTLFR